MLFLAQNGFRAIAHERGATAGPAKPHTATHEGLADDLAAMVEALDLKDATLVGDFLLSKRDQED